MAGVNCTPWEPGLRGDFYGNALLRKVTAADAALLSAAQLNQHVQDISGLAAEVQGADVAVWSGLRIRAFGSGSSTNTGLLTLFAFEDGGVGQNIGSYTMTLGTSGPAASTGFHANKDRAHSSIYNGFDPATAYLAVSTWTEVTDPEAMLSAVSPTNEPGYLEITLAHNNYRYLVPMVTAIGGGGQMTAVRLVYRPLAMKGHGMKIDGR